MRQMRVMQRRDLHAAFVDQLSIGLIQPAIFQRLLIQERAGIGGGERNLHGVGVHLSGEADGFLDGLAGFARQAEDEGAVDFDAEFMAILGESFGDLNQHALLDIVQDLLIAAFVADQQQAQAVIFQHFEGFARHVGLGVA